MPLKSQTPRDMPRPGDRIVFRAHPVEPRRHCLEDGATYTVRQVFVLYQTNPFDLVELEEQPGYVFHVGRFERAPKGAL